MGVGFIVIRCLTTALLTSLLGYFGFIEMTDRLGSSGLLPPSVINKTEHDHLTIYRGVTALCSKLKMSTILKVLFGRISSES